MPAPPLLSEAAMVRIRFIDAVLKKRIRAR
jgi:hypothetical protein